MLFRSYVPSFPLNQFIDSFIYYKDFNPEHNIDRFLPDGNIEIVIDLTDTPKFIYDNETLKEIQSCRNVWISGIRNKYITIPSGRDSEMLIINFRKGKVSPFVQIPLSELTDSVIDAELVLSNEILNLREALLGIPSVKQKFIYVERQLMKRFGKNLTENPFIDYAITKILQSPDTTTISEVSRKVGYSQKHLIQLFNNHVGITPVAFLRIIRFQKAVAEIETKKQISWTEIAHECGYFDQSHFIADFKKFSGFTPSAYLKQKANFLNYVPVG